VTDIAARRLHAQRLTGEPFASVVEAVRWLGAVQSQDYAGAKWALGQRTAGALERDVDRLFDEGAILRTHVLRPTWHFVLPDDIRWQLELTGPRIGLGLAARYRQLEIDEDVAARACEALAAALAGGRYLTRPELGEVLRAAGISPEGQRLPHLLMRAERAPPWQAAHLCAARGARAEGTCAGPPRSAGRARHAVLPEPRPGPGPGLRLVVWPDRGRRAQRDRARRRRARPPGRGGQGLLVRRRG
jgi:hypothetical protein